MTHDGTANVFFCAPLAWGPTHFENASKSHGVVAQANRPVSIYYKSSICALR